MDLVLLGPPGAGKGTQAERLIARYALAHLSTGELLRAAVATDSPLGKEARGYLEKGQLAPDELVIRLVREKIREADNRGVLFDGFPRTAAQARALDAALEEAGRRVARAIFLNASAPAIIERLGGRLTCKNCGAVFHEKYRPPQAAGVCDQCGQAALFVRQDDRPQTIRARLQAYREQTSEVVDYYRRDGRLLEIAADGAPEAVGQAVAEGLEG